MGRAEDVDMQQDDILQGAVDADGRGLLVCNAGPYTQLRPQLGRNGRTSRELCSVLCWQVQPVLYRTVAA